MNGLRGLFGILAAALLSGAASAQDQATLALHAALLAPFRFSGMRRTCNLLFQDMARHKAVGDRR